MRQRALSEPAAAIGAPASRLAEDALNDGHAPGACRDVSPRGEPLDDRQRVRRPEARRPGDRLTSDDVTDPPLSVLSIEKEHHDSTLAFSRAFAFNVTGYDERVGSGAGEITVSSTTSNRNAGIMDRRLSRQG